MITCPQSARIHFRRPWLLTMPALLVCCLALAGCGDTTATVNINSARGSFSIVATGGDGDVKAFEDKMQSFLAEGLGTGSGVTVKAVDGDHHAGPSICQTDVDNQDLHYHFAVYSTVSMASNVCTTLADAGK